MSAVFAPVVIAVLMFTGGDDEKGYLGVQLKKEADDGPIVIQAVVDDSPAAKAGLKEDDVIFKLNGDEVTDLGDFVKKIGAAKPGDEIKLVVKREGKEKEVKVKLGKKPDSN